MGNDELLSRIEDLGRDPGLTLDGFKERGMFPSPTLDEMIENQKRRRNELPPEKRSYSSGLSLEGFKEKGMFPDLNG